CVRRDLCRLVSIRSPHGGADVDRVAGRVPLGKCALDGESVALDGYTACKARPEGEVTRTHVERSACALAEAAHRPEDIVATIGLTSADRGFAIETDKVRGSGDGGIGAGRHGAASLEADSEVEAADGVQVNAADVEVG